MHRGTYLYLASLHRWQTFVWPSLCAITWYFSALCRCTWSCMSQGHQEGLSFGVMGLCYRELSGVKSFLNAFLKESQNDVSKLPGISWQVLKPRLDSPSLNTLVTLVVLAGLHDCCRDCSSRACGGSSGYCTVLAGTYGRASARFEQHPAASRH